MKVYESIDLFEAKGPAMVTLGTFDGVHVGHKKILERLITTSRKRNFRSVLITFSPHPRLVLQTNQNDLKLLNTLDEKIELLDHSGLDNLIIHPFTQEFSRLSYTAFVRDMLVNMIGMRSMVVGYNHQFGRNREGSFEKLMELSKVYDFEVEEIPPQDIDEVAISSTKIRKALLEGDVVKANMFLGYDYLINGKVVPGSQQGRSIDYPTANVAVSSTDKLIPADGVYAARVTVNDQTLMGMVNIGMRPTVQGKDRTVEVHIIDFDSNIYDLNITLHLVERIRDEKKFDDLEALRKQLDIDRNKITQILEKSAR